MPNVVKGIIHHIEPVCQQIIIAAQDAVRRSSGETVFFTCIFLLVSLLTMYWVLFLVLPGYIKDRHLRHLPQVPGKLPVFGHVLILMKGAPWTKMANWSLNPSNMTDKGKKADTQRVNRLVTFSVFHQRVVYINDPALLRRVLLTNQRNYVKDIDSSYKHFMCLLGKGLVTSEGEKWKKGRLLLSHALRIDILEEIPEMSMRGVGRIMHKLAAIDEKVPFVDLSEEFRHMTLQVIGETALSLKSEETDRIFSALYLPIVHECNRRVWEPWRPLLPFLQGCRERRGCLRKLNQVLCEIIRNRWENRHLGQGRDLMALCMSQISKLDGSMVLQLRDDVKTILLAGHETSAALLTWATYEVICHPHVQEKIVEEAKVLFDPSRCKKKIETPFGTWGVPTASDVRTMLRWSPAVLRETLRLHSVVPLVMRRAVKNDKWLAAETGLERDVVIPAGCSVAVGIQAVHTRPDIWPDPEAFLPERFIDVDLANNTNFQDENCKKSIDPYAFIPFINGPRNCLGQHLSIVETEVALAYLFLNWDLGLYGAGAKEGGVTSRAFQEEVGRPHNFLTPIVPHDGLKVVGALRGL